MADVDRLLGARADDPWRRTLEEADRTTDEWRDEGPWLVLLLLPMAALAFSPRLAPGAAARALAACRRRRCVRVRGPVGTARPSRQQAARAIEEGDTGRAAAVAPDLRWRGAALYRGGRYDESAEAFAGGDTADDHYNRGNALARAGDLRGALDAWGETLARDPRHEDAEHNRKIVESMLESQPEPQRGDGEQGGDGRDGGGTSPQGAGDGRPDRAGSRPEEDIQAGGRGGSGKGAPDTGGGSETRGGPDDRSGAGGGERPQSAQASEGSHAARGNEAGEAGAEARGGSAAGADRTRNGPGTEASLTEEQRLAYKQWIRRIPDDPGGLLRRKFALEYRARGDRPPARSDAW